MSARSHHTVVSSGKAESFAFSHIRFYNKILPDDSTYLHTQQRTQDCLDLTQSSRAVRRLSAKRLGRGVLWADPRRDRHFYGIYGSRFSEHLPANWDARSPGLINSLFLYLQSLRLSSRIWIDFQVSGRSFHFLFQISSFVFRICSDPIVPLTRHSSLYFPRWHREHRAWRVADHALRHTPPSIDR
jgi:hypothetical protein